MNRIKAQRRLEIVFWVGAVAFLKQLKKRRAFLYVPSVLLVASCLSITVWVILSANSVIMIDKPSGASPIAAKAHHLDNQHNTLVILVDQIGQPATQLEGMWLVVRYLSRPQVLLLPLYPASTPEKAMEMEILVRLFRLNSDGSPASFFLDALRAEDIGWDNMLVLDRVSLAQLVELGGGVNLGQGMLSGDQAVAQLPSAMLSPEDALSTQAAFIQELCKQTPQYGPSGDLFTEIQQFSGHIYSDSDFHRVVAGWIQLQDEIGAVSCETPTIHETTKPVN